MYRRKLLELESLCDKVCGTVLGVEWNHTTLRAIMGPIEPLLSEYVQTLKTETTKNIKNEWFTCDIESRMILGIVVVNITEIHNNVDVPFFANVVKTLIQYFTRINNRERGLGIRVPYRSEFMQYLESKSTIYLVFEKIGDTAITFRVADGIVKKKITVPDADYNP
jgi:hypothetical protein